MLKKKILSIVGLPVIFLSMTLATSSNGVTAINDEKSNSCIITFSLDKSGEDGVYFEHDATKEIKTYAVTIRRGLTWGRVKNKIDPVKKDGYGTPKYENHTFKCWAINNVSMYDSYTFDSSNITINCKWNTVVTETNFSAAPWDELAEKAEQGLDKLIEWYKPTGNTFIIQQESERDEKTKYVEIDGLKNPAREDGLFGVHVIGENHDAISGASGRVASLTFEFDDIVLPNVGYSYTSAIGHQTYSSSSIRDTLNNYLFPQIQDKLRVNIKSIDKKEDDGLGNDNVVTNSEQLFLLSRSEISSNDTDDIRLENSYYPYYEMETEQGEKVHSRMKYYKGIKMPYWLRSPNITANEDSKAYYCNGTDVKTKEVETSMGVAPCFAIGEDNAYKVTLESNAIKFHTYENFATKTMPYYGYVSVDETEYDIPDDINFYVNGARISKGTDYDYDSSTGVFNIHQDAIKGDVIVNQDISKSLFKTDSWENMIETSIISLDAMKQKYGIDNFVGKMRTITLKDGSKHWVRVVAEKHEKFANDNESTLTFEFITPVAEMKWTDANDNYDYINGTINNYLNGDGGFVYSKMPFTPGECKKQVAINETGSSYELKDFTPRMWVASNKELNIADTSYVKEEGSTYKYYENATNDKRVKYNSYKGKLANAYWTRSALSDGNHSDKSYMVSTTGSGTSEAIGSTHYIYPCFCIGKAATPYKISFNGTNIMINGSYSFNVDGYSGSKYTYTLTPDTNYRAPKDDVSIVYKKTDEETGETKWVDLEHEYTFNTSDNTGTLSFTMPEGEVSFSVAGAYNGSDKKWWDEVDDPELKIGTKKQFIMKNQSGNDITVIARLIGKEQDNLATTSSNAEGSKGKAKTTWEMVNNYTNGTWGEGGVQIFSENGTWLDSPARTVYTNIYNQLDEKMKKTIKKVDKKVAMPEVNGERQIVTTSDYFTIPCLANIFSAQGIENSTGIDAIDRKYLPLEGVQYQYYRDGDKAGTSFSGLSDATLESAGEIGIPDGHPTASEAVSGNDWGGCWWQLRSRFSGNHKNELMYFSSGYDFYNYTQSWGYDFTGMQFCI